jgi:MFS family permease
MARTRLSRDFRFLWASSAVSGLGDRVSRLAFPTIAVLVLHAGPLALGALATLQSLPLLLLSMVSGVFADRANRRRLVISCELACMLATGSVPLVAALGHLTLAQLFAATFVNGAVANLGDITFYSIVPAVVQRGDFDVANARLEGTRIVNMIGGPGVGGALIQAFGSARAVCADAVSFLLSALLLVCIQPSPPRRQSAQSPASFRRDLVDGARFVFGDRRLRRLAFTSGTGNFGTGMAFAVLLIYIYRTIGLSPGGLGIIVMATAAVGALFAFNAPAICRRVGYARTLAISAACDGVGWMLLPLAGHSGFTVAVVIVVTAHLLMAVESGLWNVAMITLRRAFTPDEMFGRMVASTRTVAQGTQPLGAIVGGVLGASLGVAPTIAIGGALMACCGLLALDPELRRVGAAGVEADSEAATA